MKIMSKKILLFMFSLSITYLIIIYWFIVHLFFIIHLFVYICFLRVSQFPDCSACLLRELERCRAQCQSKNAAWCEQNACVSNNACGWCAYMTLPWWCRKRKTAAYLRRCKILLYLFNYYLLCLCIIYSSIYKNIIYYLFVYYHYLFLF